MGGIHLPGPLYVSLLRHTTPLSPILQHNPPWVPEHVRMGRLIGRRELPSDGTAR